MSPRLRPVAAVFAVFGAFWGTWAVAAADIERHLILSHGGLGLLLSVAAGGGGLAAASAGGIAARWGPDRTLTRALVGWGVVSLATAAAAGRLAFMALFVAAMVGAGLVDMAMNTAAAARLAGQASRMIRLHALFNAGALVGAALTATTLSLGSTWRWSWAATGTAALVLAAVVRGDSDPASTPVAAPAGAFRGPVAALRAEHLGLLAVVFAATTVVEGGIDTWGVLYLRTYLAAGVLVGAGAFAVGQSLAVITRGAGGGVIGRLGARWGLVVGAAAAAAGLGAEALSTRVAAAAFGLAVAAGGISLCWPLVMSMLADRGGATGESPAALVGAFTAAGYLGFVTGPALVGGVADAWGLDAGLLLLAALAAAAAVVLVATPARMPAR